MLEYHPIPAPLLQLFRLTLQSKGKQSNAYSMGETVEDAFRRYIARAVNRKENTNDIKFIEGDLANPHGQLYR